MIVSERPLALHLGVVEEIDAGIERGGHALARAVGCRGWLPVGDPGANDSSLTLRPDAPRRRYRIVDIVDIRKRKDARTPGR